jgi:hypothetical protein
MVKVGDKIKITTDVEVLEGYSINPVDARSMAGKICKVRALFNRSPDSIAYPDFIQTDIGCGNGNFWWLHNERGYTKLNSQMDFSFNA